MMRVAPQLEPPGFHTDIRLAGENILLELTGATSQPRRGRKRAVVAGTIETIPAKVLERPQNAIWRRAIPDLMRLYNHTCAYLGVRISDFVTVDHFRPVSRHQKQAYDWNNFRLSTPLVNTFKGNHEDVLDPFLVQPGWFELTLLTGEIDPGKHVSDPALLDAIEATIRRLRLKENKTWTDRRREAFDRYIAYHDPNYPSDYPKWNLATLSIEFPFVAYEVIRQGKNY